MEICSIASGSSGNCICAGTQNCHLMIDAGISGKRIEAGLNSVGLKTAEMEGILITHEHSDHISGLGVIARRYGLPIYGTKGTLEAIANTPSVGKIDPSLYRVLEPDMDMGELFYLLREGEEELLAKLKSSIYPLGSYQVIPPPANPEHYMEWKKGEVRHFLELLLEKTDFEVLLLDLGCVMSGFFEVLDLCQKIWILKENRTSKDPGIEELKELLEKFKEGLTGRMEEVFLPGGQAWREDGTIQVEEFYMGEVGNCVRRLLGGEYAS
jgi:metal-dependent hydrolase (beta-lactamase superfamily II)